MDKLKRTWTEVIKPAFDSLPERVLGLYERVCAEAADYAQESRTLNMPWPDQYAEAAQHQVSLKLAFEELPTEVLAQAAATVYYYYGHWSSDRHSYKGNGGTWKFANYADRILRTRCLVASTSTGPAVDGISFEIHTGVLRVCCADANSWRWTEVGLGTPGTHREAKLFQRAATGVLSTFGRRRWPRRCGRRAASWLSSAIAKRHCSERPSRACNV